ncbi:aspartate 1-decarboxylase [Candidatus Sumerlaeota bacterium]|nr:aspartate 1-decarboxylase [Candidatus Sumerlaeota bacterium]
MALYEFLKSKLHGATVTQAHLDYQGSIGIPEDLMRAAKLREYERVMVADLTSGNRLSTYVLRLEPGCGEISMNGAAAHLIQKDNHIIVFSWTMLTEDEVKDHHPALVFLDAHNKIREIKTGEIHAPA